MQYRLSRANRCRTDMHCPQGAGTVLLATDRLNYSVVNPLTGFSVLEREIPLAELLPVLSVCIGILENRFDYPVQLCRIFRNGTGNERFILETRLRTSLFGRLAELAKYIDGDAIDESVDRCPSKVQ